MIRSVHTRQHTNHPETVHTAHGLTRQVTIITILTMICVMNDIELTCHLPPFPVAHGVKR